MAEFIAGFEPGSFVEFTSTSGVSIESTVVRSGNYAVLAPGSGNCTALSVFDPAEDEVVLRLGLRFSSAPSGDIILAIIRSGTGTRATLYITSSRQLKVLALGGTAETGSTVLAVDTYYLLEFRFKAGDGDNAEAEVRINGGVSEALCDDGTGTLGADGFYITASGIGNTYYDDVRFTTVVWPGDGKIVGLRPNGAGDSDTNYSGDYTDINDDPINARSPYGPSTS